MTLSGLGKDSADDQRTVDVYWLRKYGYLNSYKSGGIKWGDDSSIGVEGDTLASPPYVRLHYTITRNHSGEKVLKNYKIYLTTSPCHFGGLRYWFKCPLSSSGIPCGRRVGVLYGAGDYYGCRHCYDLTYDSRRRYYSGEMAPTFRILDKEMRMDKIRKTMKRRYYAGRPTRKQRRLDQLQSQRMPDIADFYRQQAYNDYERPQE